MFVRGAIAATSVASVMNNPAEAARAPSGDTYAITGIGAAMMSLTISRVELSSPPGVSMRMIATSAPSSSASSSACPRRYCSVAESIVPVSSIEYAVPPC